MTFSTTLVERKNLLPLLGIKPRFLGSKGPATGPYPKLDESNPHIPTP
jgi:hypothetical protein